MSNINNDIQKACLILKNEIQDLKPISVVEYEDLYVFDTKFRTSKGLENHFLGLLAVSKDGKVFGFNPLANNPKEYFKAAKNKIIL